MRTLGTILIFAVTCCTGVGMCDMPTSTPMSTENIEDIDQQINTVKEQISKYNSLANSFDRKASELQSHDFSGSRHAASIRDKLVNLAQDQQVELKKLEKIREELLSQKKNSVPN